MTRRAVSAALLLLLLPVPGLALTIQREVKVGQKTCDIVTWTDSDGKERSVALVRADGDGKFSGGYVEQYTFFHGDAKKTARSDNTMPNVSGMGCAVNHHKGASTSKADSANAKTEFVFAGPSHCLWRFRSDYSGQGKTVGLVIDWFIADGRKDILWSVSYDCSKLKDKEINWDARGPYFQFDWDGDGQFFGAKISGIRWGDRYHFKTVKYDGDKSSWDYTRPNVIPYMLLYKDQSQGDAECGVVATVPWEEKDAGGYWWSIKNWGKTGQGMMENWNCPFQLNAYEKYGGEKMAWGTPFGFVGSAQYQTLDLKTTRKGHPFQGYSVHIVLNRHSDGLTDALIASLEAVQKCKLTATTGTVALSGPNYAGHAEKGNYKTPGWDPVYGQWTVACTNNAIQCNLNIAGGTLLNPTFCFTDYRADKPPAKLLLGGQPLQPGKDCFLSLDPAGKRLFLTLNRKLTGPENGLQF
jgi:hypothetical protein